jgi:hypothetical protein
MALGVDDIIEGVATPAVLLGLGVVVAAPFLLVGSRPLAKRMIHVYLDASEKVREASAETREKWSDLLAEVKAERAARASEKITAS